MRDLSNSQQLFASLDVRHDGDSGLADNPDQVALANSFVHMDFSVILIAIGLSLLTGVLAGLYPAIRIGRLAPATFLKTQ